MSSLRDAIQLCKREPADRLLSRSADESTMFRQSILGLYCFHNGKNSANDHTWKYSIVNYSYSYPGEKCKSHYCRSFWIIWEPESKIQIKKTHNCLLRNFIFYFSISMFCFRFNFTLLFQWFMFLIFLNFLPFCFSKPCLNGISYTAPPCQSSSQTDSNTSANPVSQSIGWAPSWI